MLYAFGLDYRYLMSSLSTPLQMMDKVVATNALWHSAINAAQVSHVIVHLLSRTIMSVASPTVLPRSALFPTLLPRPPQPHPTPLQKYGRPGRLNSRRNLLQEMDDLSDEEDELDDLVRTHHVYS